MTLPKLYEITLPLLQILKDDVPRTRKETTELVCEYFKLTEGAEIELVINSDGGLEVSCEFEVVETFTEQAKYNQVFVSIVAKDEKNKTIEFSTVTSGEMRTDDSDGSQFLDFMMGEPGSKSTFTFTGSVFDMETFSINKEATLQSVEKIKSFKVLTDR